MDTDAGKQDASDAKLAVMMKKQEERLRDMNVLKRRIVSLQPAKQLTPTKTDSGADTDELSKRARKKAKKGLQPKMQQLRRKRMRTRNRCLHH